MDFFMYFVLNAKNKFPSNTIYKKNIRNTNVILESINFLFSVLQFIKSENYIT